MGINGCPVCLEKQRRIDALEEENKGLKAKLSYQERKMQDGPFGSSTPSSKIPIKPNTGSKEKKPRGGRPGHKGNGRKSHDEAVDRTVDVEPTSDKCPECGGPLENKGWAERSVVDSPSKSP
jgi:transposase